MVVYFYMHLTTLIWLQVNIVCRRRQFDKFCCKTYLSKPFEWQQNQKNISPPVFNRPSVAGAVLQTVSKLINWLLTYWSFYSQYLGHHKSQTVRARELKLGENVHPPMCHMSHVTCHMSHVKCHVSGVTLLAKF